MDILAPVFQLLHVYSNYMQAGLLRNNNSQQDAFTDALCLEDVPLWCQIITLHLVLMYDNFTMLIGFRPLSEVYISLSSGEHERMFGIQIRCYLISAHINTQFILPWFGPFSQGFLMRNVTAVQNEVGHEPWCLLSKPKIQCAHPFPSVLLLIPTFPLNVARARHSLLAVIYWCYYQVINCSIFYKYEPNRMTFQFLKPAAEEMLPTVKSIYSPQWCCSTKIFHSPVSDSGKSLA